jgi:hypothetical protein
MLRRRWPVAATALGHAASSGTGSSGGRAGARRRRGSKGAEAAADLGASAVAHGKLTVHGGCGGVRRPRRALAMAARGGLPGQGGARRGGRGGVGCGGRGRPWPWQTRGAVARPILVATKVCSHLELLLHLRDFLLHSPRRRLEQAAMVVQYEVCSVLLVARSQRHLHPVCLPGPRSYAPGTGPP